MKKIIALLLASIMLLSIPVFGSSDTAFAAASAAQSVATKSERKGQYAIRRTWRTGRKVVSATKKIVS